MMSNIERKIALASTRAPEGERQHQRARDTIIYRIKKGEKERIITRITPESPREQENDKNHKALQISTISTYKIEVSVYDINPYLLLI